jgi:hypothetical protein
VEVLKIRSPSGRAYPRMSPLVLGGVIMTQASSVRAIKLTAEADFTGADLAMIVSFDPEPRPG